MKTIRDILSVLAWIGIVFLIIAIQEIAKITILDIIDPYRARVESPGYATTFILFGVLFSTVGGLIGRPRFMWSVMVVLGVIYLILRTIDYVACNYYFPQHSKEIIDLFVNLSPGIVCIIVGLIIYRLKNNTPAP
jgi:hypothetical protein